MQLRDMKPGQKGVIKGFLPGNSEYRKKLFSLGVLPNTEFEVTRIAPLGDPIEIKLRNSLSVLEKRKSKSLMLNLSK